MSAKSMISIPTTSTSSDGVLYYHISLKLPLRNITVLRRYSEFITLVDDLSKDLGINTKEFPYKLPPKSQFWKSKNELIESRRNALCEFLNCVVEDRELQNHPIVHQFLQIPGQFKFSPRLFTNEKTSSDESQLVIIDNDMDKFAWLDYLRRYRDYLSKLSSSVSIYSITQKADIRSQMSSFFLPNIDKLANCLEKLKNDRQIDSKEYETRKISIDSLKSDFLVFLNHRIFTQPFSEKPTSSSSRSGRVLGASQDQFHATENSKTVDMSNKELLGQQLQVHSSQDGELNELRKIIRRQREIGEVIKTEVDEQNELLDGFNEDVERTGQKLHKARQDAKRIL
ncbi:Piso0_001475 [Millerozyma farinosa CBS 7064]|uniref:Sorting nexin MVP1 n=1 Tax=Pichia sorbitophila (strain ATCC MYA-4447 / BCRC 22081 / CBS 7064 / NBRC 10061 / NRRL Y-12695) TaxID=559304 RepID=G8YN96_PICSO|nr:Piso0_001475 [Millerozyma farinosa CBS 7064]